jgi:hypothetical protein
VVANGIYGYCLEHDPKNPDVCIMWYPIDNVKSSQASVGTFSGYNNKPDYCAEVDVNFDFIEKRLPAKIFDGVTEWHCADLCSNCGPDETLTYPGDTTSAYRGFTCGSADYTLVISKQKSCDKTNYFNTCAFCIPNDDVTNRVALEAASTLSCDSHTFSRTSSYNGWYKHNGLVLRNQYTWDGSNTDNYCGCGYCGNYNTCQNLSEASNATPSVQLFDYYNTAAGAQNPADYKPKCSLYVEADKAWVKRASVLSTTVIPYVNSAYPSYPSALDPFKNYYQSNGRMDPYGAAENPTPNNSIGDGQAGAPYSCDDNNKTYYFNSTYVSICNSIYTNSTYSEFGVNHDASGGVTPMGMTATAYPNSRIEALKSLKNIFLRFTWGNEVYDYITGQNFPFDPQFQKISACSGNQRGADNLTSSWCSVYPKINNIIKLRDVEGREIPLVDGYYNIGSAGYYTVNFGVSIDPEQLPVAKLVVDFGDKTSKLIATQIDPSTNYNFVHYYNPQGGNQQYKIRIKVEDNWGFIGWVGLPTTGPCNAYGCANLDFDKTKSECFACDL